MTDTQPPDVTSVIALLIVVVMVASAIRYVRLPYTIALVLTGLALALAPSVPQVRLTPSLILTIFLPVLLFHGAYNLDLADLRRDLAAVSLLAVPGVALTAGLVGAVLHLAVGLAWGEALLFGAIVAATDPVAVLAIFGEVGMPRRLATIVNGESLFNDGTALALFAAVLAALQSGAFDLGATLGRLAVVMVGSLVLGAVVGLLGGAVLYRIEDALLETTITFILAYGGFLLADRLAVSGPLETVAAGVMLGAHGQRVMSAATRQQAHATWEFLSFLANSLLFLLMGLALRPVGEATVTLLGGAVWLPLLAAIGAVLAARIIVVVCVGAGLTWSGHRVPRGWYSIVTWAGLRGAVSIAAALSIPANLTQRDLLLALTFGIVVFTLLVQGLTMRPLIVWRGLAGASEGEGAA